MKIKFNPLYLSIILMLFTQMSCSDVWDKHYNDTSITQKSDLDLHSYIQTQAELSVFAQMLSISGYDSLLSKSNTYTVWAPVNSALSAVNLSDTVLVSEIVKNHIARFAYPTSGISNKVIYMLDKKFVVFKNNNAAYTFGGNDLILDKSNVATKNGIVHQLNGYVPYLPNIWEFINKTPGLDSLRAYLYSQSTFEFDAATSAEIGTNAFGQSIYDSVIIFTNPVLSKIGALHLEDSVYSAILPNNQAWTKAYNQIKGKYVTLGANGAKQQRLNTQWAIVRDLIFRSSAELSAQDSIVSTRGSIFRTPAYLFQNAAKSSLSNGFAYVTDSLRYKAQDSYQQKIVVEGENSSYGRTSQFANLYIRSSLGSAFATAVSGSKFLVCESNTPTITTPNTVTIPIPNTLSGTYNIYCVFVPLNIVNATDKKPYKVKFYLSYMGSDGKQVTNAAVDATNTVTKPNYIPATFTTKAQQITKQFVAKHTFSYCNILNDGDAVSTITTALKIENATPITQSVAFDRSLRIDYVVFEPVQ